MLLLNMRFSSGDLKSCCSLSRAPLWIKSPSIGVLDLDLFGGDTSWSKQGSGSDCDDGGLDDEAGLEDEGGLEAADEGGLEAEDEDLEGVESMSG